jgi:hypothetical protein
VLQTPVLLREEYYPQTADDDWRSENDAVAQHTFGYGAIAPIPTALINFVNASIAATVFVGPD